MMESSRNCDADANHVISKRQHCHNENLEDRISNLPDALLCYILSLLPTLCSVRTTILAKRWNTLWTYVPNFDFDFHHFMHEWNPDKKHQDFIKFGETVLNNTNLSSIQRFSLSCLWDHHAHEISKLYELVCTAIVRNVRKFDLSIRTKSPIELPKNLFTCETLVCLKLSSTNFMSIPEVVRFSRLKILQIFNWKCVIDDPMKKILDGAPVLEELCLQNVVFQNLQTLSIRCFTLKRLTISSLYPKPFRQNLVHDVVIDTPQLQQLNIKDCNVNGLEMKQFPVLISANVHFFGFDHGVFNFLSSIPNVKRLTLFPKAGMSVVPVPDVLLSNLTNLEVKIIDNWEFVTSMLECSPNLQLLTCEKAMRCSINRHRGHPASICKWSPPINVPKCLSCLARIEIKLNGCDNEMKLVKYLLKNAIALKTMVISRSNNFMKKWEPRILKELLRFPRGSVTCEVEFRS